MGLEIRLSMLGTSISSVTFLAFPANAYKGNWLQPVRQPDVTQQANNVRRIAFVSTRIAGTDGVSLEIAK